MDYEALKVGVTILAILVPAIPLYFAYVKATRDTVKAAASSVGKEGVALIGAALAATSGQETTISTLSVRFDAFLIMFEGHLLAARHNWQAAHIRHMEIRDELAEIRNSMRDRESERIDREDRYHG